MSEKRIVAIEGPDYVGKTSVVRRLAEILEAREIPTRVHVHAASPAGADLWESALHFAMERVRIMRAITADTTTQVHIIDRWHLSAFIRGAALVTSGADLKGGHRLQMFSANEAGALRRPRVCIVVLDAPDDALDARAAMRGETRTALERAEAEHYRTVSKAMFTARINASGTLDETARAVIAAVML